MTGNQMMLSIAAMALLSVLILNVHSSATDKMVILYSNEAVIEATGIAEALFEEIQTKAFDEYTVLQAAKERNLLTPAYSLGHGLSETSANLYDDIDDYNRYENTDTANVMGEYKLSVVVRYTKETPPYEIAYERTFIKEVQITINNESLPTPLIFKKLISY